MSLEELKKNLESYKLQSERERTARLEAEKLLEAKNSEAFRANASLKKLTEDLLSEVERKNKDLLLAYNEALDASKTKTQFIATISHEMRTPLNAILGFTELIKKNYSPTNIEKYIQNIDTAAQSLLQLINDVLDLSKIETNNIEIESASFNLHILLEKIRDTYAVLAEKKGLCLTLFIDPNIPVYLIGDEHRITQVLINIISNSIKFTKTGQVSISCIIDSFYPESEFLSLRFSVNDTGIGMSEDQIPRIFELFRQADGSITRKYGGTGLGLSISNRLVKLMGGSIKVDSKIDFGSCFSFTLKLLVNKENINLQIKEKNSGMEKLKGKRALVVEDNILNTELIVDFLSSSELQVTAVENGLEAIDWYNKGNRCDFILMDMQMPVMDGIAATKNLKASKDFTIPIIAMTANATQSSLQQCLECGMAAFITKPICFNRLSNTLVRLFEESETLTPDSQLKIIEKQNTIIFLDKNPNRDDEMLDINHALSLLAGNLSIYKKMVRQFISGYEEGIYSLNELIAHGNNDDIVRLIHTMKAVAENLGTLPLANFCKQLDLSINQNDISPAKLAVNDYHHLLEKSANALSNWLASNG